MEPDKKSLVEESPNVVNPPSAEESRDTRQAEKEKKKAEKKMDTYMRSISHLSSEEKISTLSKKCLDLSEDIRSCKAAYGHLQRRLIALDREKDQLKNEYSKIVLAKSRMENLCRELQRQNKSIKEESLQKIREEEEKRKEVSIRFQGALNEVTTMMQQNTDKNMKLRDDNIEISNKFTKLCEQFKKREEEVLRLTKQMDLEKQLAEATLKKTECQLSSDREIWATEKIRLVQQLAAVTEEKMKLELNLKSLQDNLSLYSTRYEEFESTITKSNQVFDSYKVEMSRMSKQVNKLEKESSTWREKWIAAQQLANRLTNERKSVDSELAEKEKKTKKLYELCGILQEERSAYLKQLKENEITPVVVVVKKEEPKPTHKPTKKEKELSLLKGEIFKLENKLAEQLDAQSRTEATNEPPTKKSSKQVKKAKNAAKTQTKKEDKEMGNDAPSAKQSGDQIQDTTETASSLITKLNGAEKEVASPATLNEQASPATPVQSNVEIMNEASSAEPSVVVSSILQNEGAASTPANGEASSTRLTEDASSAQLNEEASPAQLNKETLSASTTSSNFYARSEPLVIEESPTQQSVEASSSDASSSSPTRSSDEPSQARSGDESSFISSGVTSPGPTTKSSTPSNEVSPSKVSSSESKEYDSSSSSETARITEEMKQIFAEASYLNTSPKDGELKTKELEIDSSALLKETDRQTELKAIAKDENDETKILSNKTDKTPIKESSAAVAKKSPKKPTEASPYKSTKAANETNSAKSTPAEAEPPVAADSSLKKEAVLPAVESSNTITVVDNAAKTKTEGASQSSDKKPDSCDKQAELDKTGKSKPRTKKSKK